MATPFYRAASEQPNLLLPLSGSGDERPPLIPPIICAAQGEPGGTIPIARLILAGTCPDCGQNTICSGCGNCHYCQDIALPCSSIHRVSRLRRRIGGARCQ